MGSGFKDWSPGDVLTAADVDGYLMRQTVMTFADASARDTALSGVLDEGMVAYLEDTNATTYYNGSSWQDIRGLGSGSATSPGNFSSGDVIDAADMNGLNAGLIATSFGPDATITTSDTDITDVSFTLATSRQLMLAINIGVISSISTDLICYFEIWDTNAAGSPSSKYSRVTQTCLTGFNASHSSFNILNFSAGTHNLYLIAYTSTGSVVCNEVTSVNARNRLAVFDVGET